MPGTDPHEIREVDGDAWDLFLRGATGTTPFSTSPWLACAAAAGVAPRILGAFQRDQLIAGVAGAETGRGWRRRFTTPRLFPHTGFVFRAATTDRPVHVESERAAATRALIQHLQGRYPRVHLTHAPDLADAREFLWAGWEVTPRFTYCIDLPADRQVVWDGFERRTRTAVRKAEREGFRVEPAADAAELRHLYARIYGGEAEAPIAAAAVEAMARQALERGLASGWRVLSPGGQTAAVVLFAAGGDTLFAWVAGADPAHRESGAASLLYWQVLASTPCRRFDFAGANLPAIALFKRGFGGRLVTYYATAGCANPLLRTAVRLRRLAD